MVKKIIAFLKDVDILWLQWIPMIISPVFCIGGGLVAQAIFQGETPFSITSIIIACSAFILSIWPIAQILRHEQRFVAGHSIKGMWPVISGTVGVIFLWFIAITILCVGLFSDYK
jgi:hypothetical protein